MIHYFSYTTNFSINKINKFAYLSIFDLNKRKMVEKISKSQVLERIQFENYWWRNSSIEEDYNAMQRRLYFNILNLWSLTFL